MKKAREIKFDPVRGTRESTVLIRKANRAGKPWILVYLQPQFSQRENGSCWQTLTPCPIRLYILAKRLLASKVQFYQEGKLVVTGCSLTKVLRYAAVGSGLPKAHQASGPRWGQS